MFMIKGCLWGYILFIVMFNIDNDVKIWVYRFFRSIYYLNYKGEY